ncbi:MAG: hypothetical protein U1E65_12040 [Myxococcota bacterium]
MANGSSGSAPARNKLEADRLQREHSELELRLSELNSRLYLSPQEQLERNMLKKLKLAKKDRIAALLVSYSGNS